MKEFDEKRKALENLQVPDDFEARLRSKLAAVPPKKKRIAPWLIAVAVLCIAFASINYPALAFYGKTLFGYEELMSESIQKLNKEGYGQQMSEQLVLEDGTVFTLEGIMSDRNQFELYYTVTGDGEQFFSEYLFLEVTGFLTSANAESGMFDMENNKGVQKFESVNAFAKQLTLSFIYKNQPYELEFPYDANKAIPTTLKKRINETFEFDFGTVKFKTLYATKGTTRLEGTLKETTDRNISYDFSQVVLVADGKDLTFIGSGMQSGKGLSYDFEINYPTLPNDMKKLAIEVRQFLGKETVKKSVPIQVGTYQIGPTELEIVSVALEDDKTKIRIASNEDVMYDDVWIETEELDQIRLAGSENYSEGTGKKERTLIFETTDKAKELYIGNVYYDKAYTEVIPVPIK